ncbi:MAG TPA: PfkB family carbohydrate kinase [Gemmatimonadaceae bacterium]|nr:PfkB family carbohydrate kinase [Gemmatimonadaceae bacterium]
MKLLEIAGGLYREACREPFIYNELRGSGGRAAWVAVELGCAARLHTCVDDTTNEDAKEWASTVGMSLAAHETRAVPSFAYVHALSIPVIRPHPLELMDKTRVDVEAETVLRFGMLEANTIVRAKTAVYDPQSAFSPEPFRANGSTAARLGIVANESEARSLAGNAVATPAELAMTIRNREQAEVAVVKAGASGAWVADAHEVVHVPSRVTPRVWSIGSGDVFASVFAVRWALEDANAADAASEASRAVAAYVDRQVPPKREDLVESERYPQASNQVPRGQVYLAAPFFCVAQRWLVEECRASMPRTVKVFSPLHDVGRGPFDEVAEADLRALDASDAVLALVEGCDPGTLVEVGHARARGIPVVALAESLSEESLVMLRGTGCIITQDLVSAIYNVVWQLGTTKSR